MNGPNSMKDAGGLIRGGAAWLRPVPPEESERLRQKFVEHAERERREKFWERVQQLRQPA